MISLAKFMSGIVMIVIVLTVLSYVWNQKLVYHPVEYSEPFTIERVEYLQGGFWEHPRTVTYQSDGSTIVVKGTLLVPSKRATLRESLGEYTLEEAL